MPYGKSGSTSTSRARRGSASRRTSRKRKSASSSSRSRRRSSASTRAPRKRKKTTTTKRTTTKRKAKLYTRYDPLTGERARVPASDERKEDWLTPTQWRSEKKRREKEREKAVKAVATAAPAVLQQVPSAVATARERIGAGVTALRSARLATGAGVASVGIGTAAALAILAGAASYFGTRWVIEKFGTRLSKSDRAFRAAQAYREARRDAEKKLGRDLTPDEHAYLARDFKAKLKSIGWG